MGDFLGLRGEQLAIAGAMKSGRGFARQDA
jgi:hypothetical protein